VALLGLVLVFALWPSSEPPEATRTAAASTPARPGEPDATGSVAPPPGDRTLRGVPEVVDTVTLRLEGRIVRLFGVEWARGGQPDELKSYLGSREVECEPVQGKNTHRCYVEKNDLSRVVLYNGGGRTTADATPELLQAEERARDGKLGVWKR
jgi:endonuclease YncB( thermonuclease family)